MSPLPHLLHLAAAIVWVGGMTFLLLVLRPAAHAQLAPPQRLPLMVAVLGRFFWAVWASIAVLFGTGLPALLATGMAAAPPGWHLMLGLGMVMTLVFAHLWFAPWQRLRRAAAATDWPAAGQQIAQIVLLARINLVLGWVAIAGVLLWRSGAAG